MTRSMKRRLAALSTLSVLFCGSSVVNAAPWYVATYTGGGTTTDSMSNLMAASAPIASGSFNLLDFFDPSNPNISNFSLNKAHPGATAGDDNNYGVVGSGILNVTTSGTYIFRTSADDGSKIALNGRNIVSTDSCCTNFNSAPITLTAGDKMRIQWFFKEGGGGSSGELAVSSDGGTTFNLLGQGTDGAFTAAPGLVVDQSFPGALFPSHFGTSGSGLKGEYWAATHPNSNTSTNAFLAGNPTPTGTFISTTPLYTASGTINAHLGADAASLTAGGTNGTDNSVFRLTGFLRVDNVDDFDPSQAGIQVAFRLLSDDNSRLTINGMTIAEYDGGHGFNDGNNNDTGLSSTTEHGIGTQILTFSDAGYYAIQAYYHNGGGGLGLSLQSSIGANGPIFPLAPLPASRLFQSVVIPEPATASLALMGLSGLMMRRRRMA